MKTDLWVVNVSAHPPSHSPHPWFLPQTAQSLSVSVSPSLPLSNPLWPRKHNPLSFRAKSASLVSERPHPPSLNRVGWMHITQTEEKQPGASYFRELEVACRTRHRLKGCAEEDPVNLSRVDHLAFHIQKCLLWPDDKWLGLYFWHKVKYVGDTQSVNQMNGSTKKGDYVKWQFMTEKHWALQDPFLNLIHET